MKKLNLIVCLALVSCFAQSQWTSLNPLPNISSLNSVFFVDANTGYAAGGSGTILKTLDGGATWTGKSISPADDMDDMSISLDIISVYFSDATTGYAWGFLPDWYGQGIIKYKTIDSGATWNEDFSGGNPEWRPSFYYIDSNTGYQVGGNSIMKTTDGGTTWDNLYSLHSGIEKLNSVFFTDANTGYAVGIKSNGDNYEGIILKTIDGGTTWTKQQSGTTCSLNSVFFTDSNTGYIVGGLRNYMNDEGVILRTTNGGSTWSKLSGGITSSDLHSVYFTDASTGYAVGGNYLSDHWEGTILKTIDGGISWTSFSIGTSSNLNTVYFIDSNIGYAVGSKDRGGIILKTIDGGTNWNSLWSDTTSYLNKIFFSDLNTGYAVGQNYLSDHWEGSIFKTIDGGISWTSFSIGTFSNLYSVFFTDVNTGFAVGTKYHEGTKDHEGIILKTIDGGITWTTAYTDILSGGVLLGFNSIHFIDANTGYAVGGDMRFIGEGFIFSERIIKTIDGGTTWTKLSTGGSHSNSVFFTDANIGYVVGFNQLIKDQRKGAIFKTIDGGIYWTSFESGTSATLNSLFFIDANTGYIVGDRGVILKTTNGGGLVSIKETQCPQSTFTIYPNPATNKISITTTSKSQGETQISIFSINGQLIQRDKFHNQDRFEMDVSTMQKGIYLLRIRSDKGVETQKLVLQ